MARTKGLRKKPQPLERRLMVRTNNDDFEEWQALATELGFAGVSPWLRRLGNDAVRAAKLAADTKAKQFAESHQ